MLNDIVGYMRVVRGQKKQSEPIHKREVHITFTQRRGHGQTYRFSNNEFDCTPCCQIEIAMDYKVSPAAYGQYMIVLYITRSIRYYMLKGAKKIHGLKLEYWVVGR